MRYNAMGNLLSITGDYNAKIREYIESILKPDPESDGDKVIDFAKIIPVNDEQDENECLEKWGTVCGASNTQVYFEGEGNPPTLGNLIYFDSHDTVEKIAQAISEAQPDFSVRYEHCDNETGTAGYKVFYGGYEVEGEEYEKNSPDAVTLYRELWGDGGFVYDEKQKKFVNEAEQE
ncbi:MAG: hypothetical protein NC183_06950 [Corallococcus sp.]|nr:hypothetical protein [Corallococcus sp.]